MLALSFTAFDQRRRRGSFTTHPKPVAEAGLVDLAVGYLRKAGEQEIARGAMTEALAQLGKGLDLLSSLPTHQTRQEQELDLQLPFGRALMAAKGYGAPELGEALARARQLCEQLERPEQLASVMFGLGGVLQRPG